jgi:hypothetical protein
VGSLPEVEKAWLGLMCVDELNRCPTSRDEAPVVPDMAAATAPVLGDPRSVHMQPTNNARIGWRWLVWRCFSHEYRTQRQSALATP